MSKKWRGLFIAAIVGGWTAAADRAAEACHTHSGSGHWYAIYWQPFMPAGRADHGAAVNIDTSSLTSDNSNFVNHEFWYGVVSGGRYWVEVGVKDGITYAGNDVNQHIFWADNRNGGGYHEHYPSVSWRLGAFYQNKITWAGVSCAWDVTFGGVNLGRSTNNCAGSGRYVAAGLEATRDTSTVHGGGYLQEWYRKDSGNSWHQDWSGPTGSADCPADINVYSFETEEVLHGPI